MRRSLKATACSMLALTSLVGNAQTPVVPPFTDASQSSVLLEEENRLWEEASAADKGLRLRGSLYGDAKTDQYLQSLLDELYPEFKGAIRIRTVNDPDLNAFAMPNGSLYINLGLLARLENEAQLAAVLAHEGAHFVHRHGYQQRLSAKNASAFGLGAAMFGGIVGLLGQMAAVSSIYGFSREHELEADRVSFTRMVKLNYDTQQGMRIFEILRDEAKLLDYKEPFMFASHPKLHERVEAFKELRELHPSAKSAKRTEEERFMVATQDARLSWVEQALSFSRYKSLIHVLSQPEAGKRFPRHLDYYLGEAYRLLNTPEDQEKALHAYQMALQKSPDFAPTYRAIGMIHLRDGNNFAAQVMFEKYLSISPDAEDSAFVKSYMQQIK